MPLRRVCVFPDKNPEAGPEQRDAAASVGRLLAENGLTLIYDGSAEGAPGAMADAALAAGGRAVGVVPAAVADGTPSHPGLTELQVVAGIAERNAVLADLADGFLALPGGLGSLDELFEIWTWGHLGYHDKPCGLLNRADYFTGLLRSVDDSLVERFVRETQRGMLIVDRDPEVLLRALAEFRPPETRRFQSYEDS